jgi:hypothetical protein
MSDLKATLVDLATDIATRAKAQDEEGNRVPFQERVEALKVLVQVYTAVQKHPGDADDERDGFNFADGVDPPPTEGPPDDSTVTPIRTHRRRPG